MPNLSDEPTEAMGKLAANCCRSAVPRPRRLDSGVRRNDDRGQDWGPGPGAGRGVSACGAFGAPFSRPRRPLLEICKLLDLHVPIREAGHDIEFPAHRLDVAAQRAHENKTRTHVAEYPKSGRASGSNRVGG
jgi:hypothetical protein